MVLRSDLRTSLRLALEDTSPTAPLWPDAALNEFLAQATRNYGARFPQELTASLSVTAGDTEYAFPSGVGRIVAILDDVGRAIPRTHDHGTAEPSSSYAQGWSIFAGSIYLDAPPTAAATWTIRHVTGRELIADDVSAQPIEPGDEPIVLALAEAQALTRRVIADGKRGSRSLDLSRRAHDATLRAERLIDDRRRHVRSGILS